MLSARILIVKAIEFILIAVYIQESKNKVIWFKDGHSFTKHHIKLIIPLNYFFNQNLFKNKY